MAIRGKVYNVTRYLDYHPGGATELMRGAGKDATSLFDEAHAYVNIEQLLAKCFVGPLRNTVFLNLKDSASNLDLRAKLSPPSSSLAGMLKLQSVISVSSEGLNKFDKFETPAPPQNIEIIPRFDWIQKTSELSIYYYTKSFCNPGVSIERMNDKECDIKILIANTNNSYKFSFLKSLKWPCLLKINQETGELTFKCSGFEINRLSSIQEKSRLCSRKLFRSSGRTSESSRERGRRMKLSSVITAWCLEIFLMEILSSWSWNRNLIKLSSSPSAIILFFGQMFPVSHLQCFLKSNIIFNGIFKCKSYSRTTLRLEAFESLSWFIDEAYTTLGGWEKLYMQHSI